MKRIILMLLIMQLTLMPLFAANPLRVGIVLSTGGLGDESFNDSAYAGVMRIRQQPGIQAETIDPGTVDGIEPGIRYFASRGFDIICSVGVFAAEPIAKAADDYPKQKFIIIDAQVKKPNVLSIIFDEEQGAFCAGTYAAALSKSKKIGFIGGMRSKPIETYERGFKNGVFFIDSTIEVMSSFLGDTPEAFNNQDKAFDEAMSMADRGADIISHASGKSGLGIIKAARRGNFLVIGVDSDQSRTAPGKVVASLVKKIDLALYEGVMALSSEKFKSDLWTLGMQNKGMEIIRSMFNKSLYTSEVNDTLGHIKKFILRN